MACSSSLPAAQDRPDSSNRIAELQEWMAIVSQLAPGRVDAAVSTMRSWGRESLQNVRDDLAAIRLLMCGRCPAPQQADRFRTEPVKIGAQHAWRTVYASKHIVELTEFANGRHAVGRHDLLKRGALLHTDVALRAPPILTWAATRTPAAAADDSAARRRPAGGWSDCRSPGHGEASARTRQPHPRADVREAPEHDQTVRLWYRATIAALLDRASSM